MTGVWKTVAGLFREVLWLPEARGAFLEAGLHHVAVTRGPCCPRAWPSTLPTPSGDANPPQDP